MNFEDPNGIVGQRESHVLEFKAKAILKTPAKIARGVVAFLNKDGGAFWIGYPEHDGVAGVPETIPDAERARAALQNHLIDTIEPPVQIPGEIDLAVVNGQILVTVHRGRNRPYVHRDGGRHYWIRVGDRVRDMSREEIASAFRDQPPTADDRLARVLADLRNAQQQAVKEKPALWLSLVPSEPLALDFHDKATGDQFRRWLTDPTSTGNRRLGSQFAHSSVEPELLGDRFRLGNPNISKSTQISSTGQVTFTMNRESLLSKMDGAGDLDLWPLRVVELPVSLFRLMGALLDRYGRTKQDLKIVAGFCISGIRGWRLQSGSPFEPEWDEPKVFEHDVLEIDPEQLVFDSYRLIENPDQCGLRLVRLIYGSFGFESNAIPPEFDQQQGVLRLG